MEYTTNGLPMLNGQNGMDHESWSRRKKINLQAHGYDIWYSIVIGYNGSKKEKTPANKDLKRNKKI
jgi:hypothetical protein